MTGRSLPGFLENLGDTAFATPAILWRPPTPPVPAAWAVAVLLLLVIGAACRLAPPPRSTTTSAVVENVGIFVAMLAALVLDIPQFLVLILAAGGIEWSSTRRPWQRTMADLGGRVLASYVAHRTFAALSAGMDAERYPPGRQSWTGWTDTALVVPAATLSAAMVAAAVMIAVLASIWTIESRLSTALPWRAAHPLGERIQTAVACVGLAVLAAIAWWLQPFLLLIAVPPLALFARLLRETQVQRNTGIDARTGLPNRAAFLERAEGELARGLRFGHPSSLILIELDQLAAINDEYGRVAGRAVLVGVADILRANSRSYDLAARLGDGRFALLLPETGQRDALAIAERVRAAVADAQFITNASASPLRATITIGLVVHPQQGDTLARLLDRAADALRAARDAGRNRTAAVASVVGHERAAVGAPAKSRSGRLSAALLAFARRCRPMKVPDDDAPAATWTWVAPAYIATVCAASVALFAATFTPFTSQDWPLFLTLGALAVASQHIKIDLYERGSVTVGVVVLLASALLLGPTAAIVIGVLMGLCHRHWISSPIHYVFDAGMYSLCGGLIALAVPLLDPLLPSENLVLLLPKGLILGGVYYVLNAALVVGVMALSERANPLVLWRERLDWLIPHMLVFGVLAAFMARAGQPDVLGISGLLIFAVPPLMMRLVTKQFVDRTKEHVAALREAHGRLTETNARLSASVEELEQSYAATLTAFSGMLDARDSETEGHSQRVVAHALKIGREIGLGPVEMAALEVGALLHDIGKVGVSDAILRKPGPLTAQEWAEMKKHPEIGYRLTESIPFLQSASPVVRYHHEWWNGTGYPAGLRGEDIPLVARIFTIADAFDAMVSDRPYKRGMSISAALAEVRRSAGTQFDPMVVDALLAVAERERWTETPASVSPAYSAVPAPGPPLTASRTGPGTRLQPTSD